MSTQFVFEKIIRDLIVPQMQRKGITVFTRALDPQETIVKLKEKLLEETQEVCASCTKEGLVEELGDVMEVVQAIASTHGLSLEDVLEVARAKKVEKGGFDTATYVTHISIPDDPHLVPFKAYYRARPKDYPEK